MKISVNDTELFTLSDTQKQVISNDINVDNLSTDLERRIQYILMHKYERCFKRLKDEWDKKLIDNGVQSVPTDPDAYAALVFSQPNYRDRKQRDLEAL